MINESTSTDPFFVQSIMDIMRFFRYSSCSRWRIYPPAKSGSRTWSVSWVSAEVGGRFSSETSQFLRGLVSAPLEVKFPAADREVPSLSDVLGADRYA